MTPSLRSLLAAATVTCLALLLSSCALFQAPGADPGAAPTGDPTVTSTTAAGADTGTDTGPERADVFALVVGDCFDRVGTEIVEDVQQRSCDEPHDNEIFDAIDLGSVGSVGSGSGSVGDDFPGEEVVDQLADTGCVASFESFVGIDYARSKYEVTHLTPTAESWSQGGDREVLCLVYDPSGKVTGTLAGAAA